MLEPEPPHTEIDDAPQTEKQKNPQHPPLPQIDGSGAPMPEHFSGVGPGSLGMHSLRKRK